MSWTRNPASAIALRLDSAARLNVVTPDLRENAVQPIPAIAVLSLIGCSDMFTSFYLMLCSLLSSRLFEPTRSIHAKSLRLCDSQLEQISFNSFESSSKFSAQTGSLGTILVPLNSML